jgi:hypothetical protein
VPHQMLKSLQNKKAYSSSSYRGDIRGCESVSLLQSLFPAYWWYLVIHKFPTQAPYPNASPGDWEEINLIRHSSASYFV